MGDPESAPRVEAYQLLLAARALVVRGWTAGARARDRQGRPVDPTDPSARSWSLVGALEAASANQGDGRGGDRESARARAIAIAALTAAIRGTPSDDEAVRYLEAAIDELAWKPGRGADAATIAANDDAVAVHDAPLDREDAD